MSNLPDRIQDKGNEVEKRREKIPEKPRFWSPFRFRSRDREAKEEKKRDRIGADAVATTQTLANSSQDLSQTSPVVLGTVSVPDQRQNAAPSSSSNTDSSSLWDSWELDRTFLHQIKEWDLKHPEKKLIRILEDSCNKIDKDSVLLELIPSGSLPIRGFVKSLLYLCKLGATVASAKREAIVFMQEIVTWIETLADAFESGNGGMIEKEAWKTLEEMRELIEKACHWASELLSSGLASQVSHRLSVESHIQDYRTNFSQISERFSIICGIRFAKGLDDVTFQLTDIAQGVNNVTRGINNISENEIAIKRLNFLEKKLRLPVIEHAFYKHQEKRPCDVGTRLDVLEEIRLWFQDTSENSQCFYWLSGEPGVGKSAITVSLAKECIDLDVLGAQFFINRNDEATTDPRVLFPTICWQLCERFEQVAITMEEILRATPTLIDDISDDQARQLFVNAIDAATEASPLDRTVVIVIDALDETDTKRLRDLAQIFSKVVANLPRKAKVFISSRTEDAITKPFNPLCSHKQVKSRYLAAKDSIKEVSRFMENKFKAILVENSMDWDDWKDDSQKLSSQASGLYIWAETALKFLRDEIENSGTSCVGGLLKMLTTDGMDDTNALYLKILRKTCRNGDWEHQRFRRIIGAILVRQTPLSITDIGQLLALKDHRYSTPVDLVHFVRQYRTVLVNDTNEINGRVVPRMHRSFADFITSEWAQEFRVDKSASHGEIALQCIDQIYRLIAYLKPDETQETPASFPTQLVYVSQHWHSHFTKMIEPDPNDGAEQNDELDTLDVQAEEDDTDSEGSPAVGLKRKSDDAVTSFAFSPDGTLLASSFYEDVIRIWDARTGLQITSLQHANNVYSLAFSPDGSQLVSASIDCTARIWDTRTWKRLHTLRDHDDWVWYAAFSHDGRKVVTCCVDEIVRSWDTQTGQLLKKFQGHTDTTFYCAISPNDQRMASLSWTGIFVWDLNSGTLISQISHDSLRFITFCPDSDHLISYDRNYGTIVWNSASGDQISCSNSTIAPLAFTDDSEKGSANGYISVPQAVQQPDHSIPHIYTLKAQRGEVCSILEHGRGVWEFVDDDSDMKLSFVTGATRMILLHYDSRKNCSL